MATVQLSNSDRAQSSVQGVENVASMTTTEVAALAKRLEQDAYDSPFAGLQDWHLLRSIAFQRPELAQPYLHLLDIEPFDEA